MHGVDGGAKQGLDGRVMYDAPEDVEGSDGVVVFAAPGSFRETLSLFSYRGPSAAFSGMCDLTDAFCKTGLSSGVSLRKVPDVACGIGTDDGDEVPLASLDVLDKETTGTGFDDG